MTEWFVTEGDKGKLYFHRKREIQGCPFATILARVDEEAGNPVRVDVNPTAEFSGGAINPQLILLMLTQYYVGGTATDAGAFFNQQRAAVQIAENVTSFALLCGLLSEGSVLGTTEASKLILDHGDVFKTHVDSLTIQQRIQFNKELASAARQFGAGGP